MERNGTAGTEAGIGTGTGSTRPVEPFLVLRTVDPADTQAMAATLSTILIDADLLVLTGDLGAGKTCFTQGLGRGLGIEDRITSPTFTLANRYAGRLTLNHLDVYRIDSLAETMDLGLTELLEDGVTVIEWGDRIGEVLPVDHLVIALRYPCAADASSGPDPDTPTDPGRPAEELWDDPLLNERVIELRPADGRSSRWRGRGLEALLKPWRVDR